MDPISPELLTRLPRTFVPALNEQIKNWDVLFPAERRTMSAQMSWLARLPAHEFRDLFEPIKALEARMDLPAWNPRTPRVSINDTSVLVRSPLYPQWRVAVGKVFDRIDAGVKAGKVSPAWNRLIVCTMPAGSPARTTEMWPALEAHAKWVALERPFADVLPALFSGVAGRQPPPGLEPVERTWLFEYDTLLAPAQNREQVTALSFDGLGPVRREFLARLNSIHKDLRALDQAYEDLRRIDLRPWLGAPFTADVAEFVRNLLLSGNGAILFGNSFVQWGASEALRRVQPQAMFCRFGVRGKLKPFSSVVLFEDQHRANPVPDEPDVEGSFVDSRLLSEYVYLSATRHLEFAERMLVLFAVPEQSRLLVLGTGGILPHVDLKRPLEAAPLVAAVRAWLA